MPRNHVVLVHGYSSSGRAFDRWAEILEERGYDTTEIATCTYQTLTNEVTIKDIAEGFNRALQRHEALRDGRPFDVVVHSTGMLVVRAWLTAYGRREQRLARLKRLVALAPATFGSPSRTRGGAG